MHKLANIPERINENRREINEEVMSTFDNTLSMKSQCKINIFKKIADEVKQLNTLFK